MREPAGFVPLASLVAAPPVPAVNEGGGHVHAFRVGGVPHLLIPRGSRIFAIGEDWDSRIAHALDEDLPALLNEMHIGAESFPESMEAPESMPVRSLSLAVAQKCNLACSYCYAQQ